MAKEKRQFQRYSNSVEFSLRRGEETFAAETLDYSLSGIRAMIKGASSIEEGDVLDIFLTSPDIKSRGRVVWTKGTSSGILAGIQRLDLLYGSLKDFTLADVLIGLQRSGKTGVFHLLHGPVHKNVYIKGGDMIFAASNQPEDRLGDMLLAEGRLSRQQCAESAEYMKKTGKRLGSAMVALGFMTASELLSAINDHAESIILSLFNYEEGEFFFKEGPLPSEEVITLKLSAANLIYRGIKRIKEVSCVMKHCPPLDAVPALATDPLNLFQDLRLEQADGRVLSLVDGKRSIRDIADSLGEDEFDTVKTLYALLSTRVIEKSEGPAARPETPEEEKTAVLDEMMGDAKDAQKEKDAVRMIQDMYAKYKDLGYYGVLGVAETATKAEIKRAYYQRAREFHPDRHFSLPEDMKEKLNTLFTYITTAFSTLNRSHLRSQYDSGHQGAETEALDPKEEAAGRFEQGRAALQEARHEDAARLFAEAAYLDSKDARYHYFSGKALTKGGRHKEAERAIQRALKIDPENPDYYAEAGYIFLALEFPLRARSNFQKAVELNPSHERARDGLQMVENAAS